MSSIIMPTPPSKRSMRRTPSGFTISKKRKSTNAPSAYHQRASPPGAAKSGIHTPTISSITTFEGSLPHTSSAFPADTIPNAVNRNTHTPVAQVNASCDRNKEATPHTTHANNAPAVPGATGEKPEPNPLAINRWNFVTCMFRFCKKRYKDIDFLYKMYTFNVRKIDIPLNLFLLFV